MSNEIIVAIVAALAVVAVPTLPAAEVWDKPYDRQSYIAFVAMLLTYDQHCTSLPDHIKNQIDAMAALLDRSDELELAVATMNARVDLHRTSTLKWCEAKKPLINEFVEGPATGSVKP
jgi:hypothetical protein